MHSLWRSTVPLLIFSRYGRTMSGALQADFEDTHTQLSLSHLLSIAATPFLRPSLSPSPSPSPSVCAHYCLWGGARTPV
jgi:hypothetical protein